MTNKRSEGYITTREHEQLENKPDISKVFMDREACIECGCLDPESNSVTGICGNCDNCWVLCDGETSPKKNGGKKMFYTANRETGTFIDEFETLEEAKKAIEEYEAQDKKDGVYEADFYEVEDENHCSIG